MNKNANVIIRFASLLLLLVMLLSMISCEQIEGIIGGITGGGQTGDGEGEGNEGEGEGEGDENGAPEECQHENILDGVCQSCQESFFVTIDKLNLNDILGENAPNGVSSSKIFYTRGTVKELLNDKTGEMIIEDESGEIKVKALSDKNGNAYKDMADKPDELDNIVISCTIIREGGKWNIKAATLISFEAVEAPIEVITIAEALELCGEVGNLTTERYYIRGTVKSIKNPTYGSMILEDETGEIEVYGSYSADGSIGYAELSERPVKGDEVLLYCTLQNYNGTKEIKSAWIIEYTHVDVPFDSTNYTEMTISEARDAEEGDLVMVSGVVARITYANGYIPSGVILVDGTSSIYVYNGDVAGQVKIGNTIKVAAEKTYWILDTEMNNAERFGYEGACQLDNATLVSNDKGESVFDKSWIEETTVKEIMDTPVTENITSKIFKVTALVKKAPGNGFVNYYIDDIDGVTGSYVYTQCNGGDFGWLDEFDGKFCTVYVTAINAKSSASGCIWRLLPIEVINEGYEFDVNNAAEYAVKYHGVDQFLPEYTGDPAIELITSVSSELLGFEGATLSYSSSDEEVVYFTSADGVVTFHCGKSGTATVTVTARHGEKEYSESLEITVSENEVIDYITVADAIATDKDTNVTVKGIVGPSLVNKTGFYLFGEDGSMIAVLVAESAFEGLAIGNEIIVTGMRERYIKDDAYTTYGQDAIVNGEIVANYYGSHQYSTEKFITGKTLADIKALNIEESHSTEVYVVKVTVEFVETAYYSNLKIKYDGVELPLYCSGAGQYSWLAAYAGQEITVEIAPCNWNDKKDNYRGCVLAVINEDGTKVLNTLNFQ